MEKRIIFTAVGAVVFLIMAIIIWPFSTNETGYRQHIRKFSGEEQIRFAPGFYWSGIQSTVTDWPNVITVQFEEEEDWNDEISSKNELMTGQFNDGTSAKIGFTVKWLLPSDDSSMLKIASDYRTPERLAQSLADYSRECMNYSTQLMDSEYHYSGGKSKLRDDFSYQLNNGQYVLRQIEKYEKDSLGHIIRRYYISEPIVKDDGTFQLSKSDVQEYGITPNFVAITHVDYDTLVDARLQAKIEQSTKESISKQTLMTAQQDALTEEARGQQMLAKKKAIEEADKLEAVIRAEKATAVAFEEAKRAKYVAEKTIQEKRAEAEANRLLVASGLTPEQRMERDIKIADVTTKNLAQMKWPTVFMNQSGSQNGRSVDPLEAIGMKSVYDFVREVQKDSGKD